MARETQAQKIVRIEEENARLREELHGAKAAIEEHDRLAQEPAPAPEETPARTRTEGGVLRSVASVVLIVIGSLLAPVALVANTADKLLTDTDFFVKTLEPIIEDDAVQALIIEQATLAIREQVGLDAFTSQLFDGLATLDLPPATLAALELLKQPAIDGVGALVEQVVTEIVASREFETVINESLRITHSQLIAALSGQSSTISISATGEIGIALDPILDRIKVALGVAGFGFADNWVPQTGQTIIVAQSEQAAQLVWLYQLAVAVGPWLQWVVVALLLAGVLVARRWATPIIGVGVGIALAAGLLGAGIAAGRVFTLSAVAGTLPLDAISVIYDTIVYSIVSSVTAAVVTGLALALVAALAGPFRWSVALRKLSDDAADRIRLAAEDRGVTTGAAGVFLFRWRLAIRVVVGLIAAAIILFVRPLSPATIVWTLVLALLVVFVARILERPVTLTEQVQEQPVG